MINFYKLGKLYFDKLAADWDEWYILLFQNGNFLISSPQVKRFMILAHMNISPESLIKLVASKLKMRAKAHPQNISHF